MTIKEAIEILEHYNLWRKGAEIEQPSPISVGVAIDLVVYKIKDSLKTTQPEWKPTESPFAYPDDQN